MKGEILLDLLFTKEEWVRDVKFKSCCSYSDHEMTVLRIPKRLRQKAGSHPWASGEQASACLGTKKNTDLLPSSAGIGL